MSWGTECARCHKPWDRYIGKRKCYTCGVPVLVCDACMSRSTSSQKNKKKKKEYAKKEEKKEENKEEADEKSREEKEVGGASANAEIWT